MAAGETATVIDRKPALYHSLLLSWICLTAMDTYFKATSKTYEEIFKRKECWSWLGLVFDRFYDHVFNIFSIGMLLLLGFPPSLTSYEVLEVWLIRVGVMKRKKVRKQTYISFGCSKEELCSYCQRSR